MKLLLLHGPAIKISRIKLQDLKSKFSSDNITVFEKGEELVSVLVNLQSVSLFEGERLIILENPPEDFTFLTLDSSNLTLILWFDHEVLSKKPIMDWVKKADGEILFFPEAKEVSVFPFLDFLAAKDKRAFLELDKLKTAGFDAIYLITMIFYLLRNLVATPKNAPQFVKDKLERQRRNFSMGKITSLYKEILEIDFKIKSGLLEKSQAEYLLVDKFLN